MDDKKYRIRGFRASAVAAGIKKDGGPDLALIYADGDTVAAGLFTTNKVKAAPVILSRKNIRNGKIKAIIANSGNANACTGRMGMERARKTAAMVSGKLGIKPEEVLVASTGVIGQQMDLELISVAMPDLVKSLSPEGISRASEAIMTTDSFPKVSRFRGKAGGRPYQILGVAKGAGMIMPHVATMLCFILTDIRMDLSSLRDHLRGSCEYTFNRISVDGDTSTNDMVVVLANGMAGNGKLTRTDQDLFRGGLTRVMKDLATMIVRDGEGATKLIHVQIKGAASKKDAMTAAKAVANSSLVKTAFYGQDPNWGRIMAALGRSGIRMREQDVGIWIDQVQIVGTGVGRGADYEKKAARRMARKEFSVTVHLGRGDFEDHVMTCDLTHDYISINAAYRT